MLEFDIVIVGGGLVGASLACALSDLPYSVLVLEGSAQQQLLRPLGSADSVLGFEPRVSALSAGTQAFMTQLQVWQGLEPERIGDYQHMVVWDELGTGRIQFDAADMYRDSLGCIVENQALLLQLHACLERNDRVHVAFDTGLVSFQAEHEPGTREGDGQGHRVRYELSNGEQGSAKLLVGADGVNSQVRALAHLPTREWDYGHHAIVATVQTEAPHGYTARQRFSESGPLAFLPLRDRLDEQHFCSIVWSVTSDQAEQLMDLGDAAFCQRIAQQIEFELGGVQALSPRFSFPLRQRHAKDYIAKGVALVGDAAHSIHPLAGQGVNLGFKDVQALAAQCQRAAGDRLSPSHPLLLKAYQRHRKGDNLLMMGAMEGFKQLFEQADPGVRWLRNTGLRLLNQQPQMKNRIMAKAMGL